MDPAALAATRFGLSPMLELRNALRLLHPLSRIDDPMYHQWRMSTLDAVRRAKLDLRPLYDLVPPSNYTPDFLAPVPPPATATFESELDLIAATPATRVRAELDWAEQWLNPWAGRRRRDIIRAMAEDPARTRDRAVELLPRFWDVALADLWPDIRAVLERDLAHRGALLARRGIRAVFDTIHTGVRWDVDTLHVRRRFAEEVVVDSRGLVLMPSAFAGPRLGGTTTRPWQPTVWYGAREVGRLWAPARSAAEPAMAKVVGRTRASILAALHRPTATTALAAALGLAAGNVSEHLHTLQAAGLVTSRRHRREVRYVRTPLADDLLAGAGPLP